MLSVRTNKDQQQPGTRIAPKSQVPVVPGLDANPSANPSPGQLQPAAAAGGSGGGARSAFKFPDAGGTKGKKQEPAAPAPLVRATCCAPSLRCWRAVRSASPWWQEVNPRRGDASLNPNRAGAA